MRVDRTSPWRDDHVPGDLVVGDALFDLGHELRRVAVDHLSDLRAELMEEVNPRIAANRRTKSLERRRSGPRPIWAVSRSDCNRSQHPEEIRRIQCPLPGVPARYKNTRNCVGGPAQKGATGRRIITRVLLEQRRIQVSAEKGTGLFLNQCLFIESG